MTVFVTVCVCVCVCTRARACARTHVLLTCVWHAADFVCFDAGICGLIRRTCTIQRPLMLFLPQALARENRREHSRLLLELWVNQVGGRGSRAGPVGSCNLSLAA